MAEAPGPVSASLGRSSYSRYASRIAQLSLLINRGLSLPAYGKNPYSMPRVFRIVWQRGVEPLGYHTRGQARIFQKRIR
jgi:hypothetical protein